MRNQTAEMLIELAFDVDGSEIVGLPGWADEEHFDIEAAIDQSVSQRIGQLENGANLQVSQTLMRGLLENAFGLVTHREALTIPVYELQTVSDGPKCLDLAVPEPYSGSRTLTSTKTGIKGPYITMASLADLLSEQLGIQVVDKTGLAGGYRIKLQWADKNLVPSAHSDPERDRMVIDSLKRQLGLTLLKSKASREVLVIDQVQKPNTD